MSKTKLMLGDNIQSLQKLPENSIDSIVTDPPYGLSFMGKKWDYDVPSVEFWREVYRVLKPGGHILSFGGTRTYHRMVVNIEDAGFEIRDQVMWLYGSGFPKSHNVSKAIDATMKTGKSSPSYINKSEMSKTDGQVVEVLQPNNGILGDKKLVTKTIGASLETDEAIKYEGWGTALKPANEPICVARKPLSEKTIANNVMKWGTGGINIDGCRIGNEIIETNMKNTKGGLYNLGNQDRTNEVENTFNEGRFPANIILECICDEVIKGETIDKRRMMSSANGGNNEGRYNWNNGDKNDFKSVRGHKDTLETHTNPDCVCYQLDEQSGVLKSGVVKEGHKRGKTLGEYQGSAYGKYNNTVENLDPSKFYGDKGGASRFFYVAKVSKKERNLGLDSFEDKIIEGRDEGQDERSVAYKKRPSPTKNTHPTLKPINLMTYLCRLVTPENGIVLDPFMGSGSTGIAARLEGFRFLGMEMDKEYFKIAEARIEAYEQYRDLLK